MASTEAQNAKQQGNAAFKAWKFQEAIEHYTSAISIDSKDPTFPLNRAAAYLKLGKHEDAERDCTTVLELKPGDVKALFRRSQARIELKKLDGAEKDLEEALNLDPNNSALKAELKKLDKLTKKSREQQQPVKPSAPRKLIPIQIRGRPNDMPEGMEVPNVWGTEQDGVPLIQPYDPRRDRPISSPSEKSTAPVQKSTTSDVAWNNAVKVKGVGGGVFSSSGAHLVVKQSQTSDSKSGGEAASKGKAQADSTALPSSMSLFDFSRSWESATITEKWDLICKIAPASLPFLFKTSLETSLLVDIIAVFSAAFTSNSDPVVRKAIREYLNWFPKVPRFQTITLCMSKDEKELCKSLIDAIGDVGGAWSV